MYQSSNITESIIANALQIKLITSTASKTSGTLAKRHLRKYNGIPKEHFELFLKESEWRFNTGSPKLLLKDLKNLLKQNYWVLAPKTITNMYNSGTREVVIEASYGHYDALYHAIDELTKVEDLNLSLQIKFNKVSVELDINESLIVINTLAVKRAALRGGLWSTAGKQTEGPLMETLCKLYSVSPTHYSLKPRAKKIVKGDINREVDFFLKANSKEYKCEVKLMGKGNPEGADAVIARDSAVFVADKLSDQNKTQLDQLGVQWIELRNDNGFKKFQFILENLQIPYKNWGKQAIDKQIDKILDGIFK